MADLYVEITEAQTDAKSPINETLMRGTAGATPDGGVRGNFKNHETRINALEGGGGGGGAAGIDVVDRFVEAARQLRHDRFTDKGQKQIELPFLGAEEIKYRLMAAYASGTTVYLMANPKFLESTNPDFNQTGFLWSALAGTDASSVTADSTNHFIGTTAPKWQKAGGTFVYSLLERDITAALAISIAAHRRAQMMFRTPDTTGLESFVIRISADASPSTNYVEYIETTQHRGGVFSSGASSKNIIQWDLGATPSVTAGTGFNFNTQLARSIAFGVKTTSSGQTYTGSNAITGDSLNYVPDTNSGLDEVIPTFARTWRPGSAGIIANSSTHEVILPDYASNPDVCGLVILAGALGNAYSGGAASTIRRTTLAIGDGQAAFNTDSALTSGTVENSQDVIASLALPASVTSKNVDISVDFYTDLAWHVKAKPSSTTFKFNAVDRTAELKSGDKMRLYTTRWIDGKAHYEDEAAITLTADSTFSSSEMTIQVSSGDNALVTVGDLVVKQDEVTVRAHVAAATVNDALTSAALVPTSRPVSDIGLQYPKSASIFGHYLKLTATENTATWAAKNRRGTGPDLNIVGTGAANFERAFKNGQLGAGVYSDADYFTVGTLVADSAALNPDSAGAGLVSISFWFHAQATPAGDLQFIARHDNANGWYLFYNASRQLNIGFVGGSGTVATTAAMTLGTWNHCAVVMQDGGSSAIWLNAVKTSASGNTITATGSYALSIGRTLAGAGAFLGSGYLADLVFWSNAALSDADVLSIYAQGNHALLGATPGGFKQRYQVTAQTGQKAALRATLARRANTHKSFLQKSSLIVG